MATTNQAFYDGFMVVLGLFVGVLLGIIFMKAFSAGVGPEQADDPAFRAATAERIRPIGRVALIGDPGVGVRPVVQTAVQSVSAPLSGPQVYNENCYLCHAAPGVGGAPVFGDVPAWAPRIAQGPDVLRERVIIGYQGEQGIMPPKGGRPDLSDEEIVQALEFMLSEAQRQAP